MCKALQLFKLAKKVHNKRLHVALQSFSSKIKIILTKKNTIFGTVERIKSD
ncbi:hypothetical protein EMA8858_03692 [Emticicia aquatica]|jgi:hypothetical protein|uniref:Transposase n=1 Tax=Emticicia aquatica TaxID=1681835 RepID=A0ABN8F200_9BACT|nr:hypothetical protein EMA8858_03692 [Emticicia aquatica]